MAAKKVSTETRAAGRAATASQDRSSSNCSPAPPDFAEVAKDLLLEELAPAAVVVNGQGEITYFFGHTARYLQPPPGKPTRDLLLMARRGLKSKLRTALREAIRDQRSVRIGGVPIDHNGQRRLVAATIKPLPPRDSAEELLLVVFQDVTDLSPEGARRRPEAESAAVRRLEAEMQTTDEEMQGNIADLQAINEELTVSNEEMTVLNEELQSANEELRTAKEEHQSLNEELTTVNRHLQEKISQLEAANNDLSNLLDSTDAATIFLDRELRIRRFNAAAAAVANLIATDVGRPMAHIRLKIDDVELLADARRVLHELTARECEIETDQGRSWFRRMVPYRTLNHRIDGVVVTFHDVTPIRQADRQARLLAAVLKDTADAIIVHDFQGRISTWNRGAERLYGYSEAEALAMNIDALIPAEARDQAHSLWQRLERGEQTQSWEAKRVTRSGDRVDVWVTLTALHDKTGRPIAIARIDRDVTERAQVRARLEEEVARRTADLTDREQRLRAILDSASDAIVTIDAGGTIESVNLAAERVFGYLADEMIGQNVKLLMPSPYHEEHDGYLARYLKTGEKRIMGSNREADAVRKDGTTFPIELAIGEVEHGKRFTGIVRDISLRKNLQREVVEIAQLEQQRVGQDLHDDCGQQLTALALLADSLVESLSKAAPADADLAYKIEQGLKRLVGHVRNISRGLVRAEVEPAALAAALAELAAQLSESSGVHCTLEGGDGVTVGDVLQATHLYHIAQEACTNALKHARAEKIDVRLFNQDGAVVLEVRDDGVGLPAKTPEGLGLRIMRNRASVIGAELTITPAEPRGTLVNCILKQERRHGPRQN